MRMTSSIGVTRWSAIALTGLVLTFVHADAQQQPQAPNPYLMGTEGLNKGPRGLTSYQPIAIDQPFAAIMAHDVAAKPGIEREHQAMLNERYDLSDRPARGVTMERGKPLQEGVRVKLPSGMTWAQLAAMSADEFVSAASGQRASFRYRIPSIRLADRCSRKWRSTRSKRRTGET